MHTSGSIGNTRYCNIPTLPTDAFASGKIYPEVPPRKQTRKSRKVSTDHVSLTLSITCRETWSFPETREKRVRNTNARLVQLSRHCWFYRSFFFVTRTFIHRLGSSILGKEIAFIIQRGQADDGEPKRKNFERYHAIDGAPEWGEEQLRGMFWACFAILDAGVRVQWLKIFNEDPSSHLVLSIYSPASSKSSTRDIPVVEFGITWFIYV